MKAVDERAGREPAVPEPYAPTVHGEATDGYFHEGGTAGAPVLDQAEGTQAASDQAQARRELLAQVSDGSLTLADLFQAADSEGDGDSRIAGHIHVRAALLALPGIGEKKADAILTEVGIEGDRHLATLGSHQREQLAEAAAAA